MEVIHECCCGLDVHQAVIVACLVNKSGKRAKKETREFRTVPAELRQLIDWLVQSKCTLVAMESTGVYWMPVYEMLEGKIALLVANAEHMRNLPGRKTDVGDAEWIADLARHGLLRASFIPAKEFRELRDLTRYRRKLIEARATQHNRLLKYLEQAGVKLSTFLSDVMGVSGRLMIKALLAGKLTPEQMAQLAKGTLRNKMDDLKLIFELHLSESQCFLIERQYEQVEHFEKAIEVVESKIAKNSKPYAAEMNLLKTIPGLDIVAAPAIIGEVGTDLSRFKNAAHFSSWIGICPGNNESAGKRKHGKTRPGNIAMKTLLVECAWSATRTRGFLRDKYYRLRARRGAKKAIVAIAHKLAIAIYQVLTKQEEYRDLGDAYLDQQKSTARRLVRRVEKLGYIVTAPAQQECALESSVNTASEQPIANNKPKVRRYTLKSSAATDSLSPTDNMLSNRVARRRSKNPLTGGADT
jgi:transposase